MPAIEAELKEQLVELVEKEKIIEAIRILRESTGTDLKTAKQTVDLIRDEVKAEKAVTEPLCIDDEVAEMIREYPEWKIKTYIDHPASQAKDEITNAIIAQEFILVPVLGPEDADIDAGVETDFGFGIGAETGPDFMTIASRLPITPALRADCLKAWKTMEKKAMGSDARPSPTRKKQNLIASSIEYYRKFFRKVVEEICEEVLHVEYKEVFSTFSTYNRIAEAVVEMGNFNYDDNFAMSLFKQAFVEGRTMTTKQEEWIKTLGDKDGPITKKGPAKKAEPGETKEEVGKRVDSHTDHLNGMCEDLDRVSFGHRGGDFYESVKNQFKAIGTLSSKQIFHLEKMHWNYRKQHGFKNQTSDSYTNFKIPAGAK